LNIIDDNYRLWSLLSPLKVIITDIFSGEQVITNIEECDVSNPGRAVFTLQLLMPMKFGEMSV